MPHMQACQRLQPGSASQAAANIQADQQGQCRQMCTPSSYSDTASMWQQHHAEG